MSMLETLKTLEQLEREMGLAGRKTEESALREARGVVARSGSTLLSTGQAAALLGVSVPTVKRWAERGTLVGAPLGKRWLVSRESVEGLVRLRDGLLALDREGNPTSEEVLSLRRRARP